MKRLALLAASCCLLITLAACGQKATSNNPNTIDMVATSFSPTKITINQGATITFLDDSDNGATHFLVTGTNGEQQSETGTPPGFNGLGGHRMEAGDVWTTTPWNTIGTFHVTCTVHPVMNLTIIVVTAPTPTPATSTATPASKS